MRGKELLLLLLLVLIQLVLQLLLQLLLRGRSVCAGRLLKAKGTPLLQQQTSVCGALLLVPVVFSLNEQAR